VYVYDGINTNNSLGYVAAFCGSVSEDSSLRSVDIFSGYLTLVYYGNGTGESSFSLTRSCRDTFNYISGLIMSRYIYLFFQKCLSAFTCVENIKN